MQSNCRMRVEALDAYLHGMLNETQQREITAHLLICAECNKTLSTIEAETYTIGKALRTIPTPAMSVSAGDLVARYAGTREGSGLDATARGTSRAERAARKVASSAVSVWNFAHSRSLGKVAGIAFVSGLAIWFAIATAKRIESINQAQNGQMAEFARIQREQEQLRLSVDRYAHENEKNLQSLNDAIVKNWEKETLNSRIQLLQEQEKISVAIVELKNKIDDVGSKINKRENDSTQLRENLEQQRKRLQELLAQQEEVKSLIDRTNRVAEKRDIPVLTEAPDEPGTIRLMATADSNLTWDDAKDGTALGALSDKGQPVGWTVSLSLLGGGSVPENIFDEQRVVDFPHFTGAAAINGRVFVGNGFADSNLVAFDGGTGKMLWTVRTRENGGGAPVVADDGRTVFFAENGMVRAINVANGVQDWNRFVGGAVLTQPALDPHHVYLVHASSRNSPPGVGDPKFPFSISCLLAESGNVVWTKGLTADAISSPVVDNGKIYVSTRDGVISVFDFHGTNLWSYQANSTSAPVISSSAMCFSAWNQNARTGFEESLCHLGFDSQAKGVEHLAGPFPARYFVSAPLQARDSSSEDGAHADVPPPMQSVPALRSTWSYMGARPTVVDQTVYVVLGDHLVSWDLKQGKANWSEKIIGKSDSPMPGNQGQPALTPPAYSNGKLYLGSIWGDMLCVDALTGAMKWRYRLPGGHSITAQIVLDRGHAYTTTSKGLLICLDSIDPSAHGWTMWGGSASHNGPSASATKWIRRVDKND
jgi:outer membrane protein assembly factor BamB